MYTNLTCKRTWIALGLLVALGSASADPVHADGIFGPVRTTESMLADELVMVARSVLAGEGELRSDQYERARILLDLAIELEPADVGLWRLRRELARQTGDRETEIKSLKHYLQMVPGDDAAQLEYVHLLIEHEQSLDGRRALVRKILYSDQVHRVTAALRSRLESYCAVAALEMGDEVGFQDHLSRALELDQTNTEATLMMYDVVQSRTTNALQRGSVLMWCVRADPLNPHMRRELAELLLGQGAYRAAAMQFSVCQRSAQQRFDDQFYLDWALALAAVGGPVATQNALAVLKRTEAEITQPRQRAGTQPLASGNQEGQAVPKLPLDLELLRLVILRNGGLAPQAEASFVRISNVLRQEQADDRQKALDLAWLTTWLGPDVSDVETLSELEAVHGSDHSVLQRIRAWTALRAGHYAEARALFDQMAQQHPQHPYLVYGQALTWPAEDPARHEHLKDLVGRWPASLPAMLAARALASTGQPPAMTAAGRSVAELIQRWPDDLREPNPDELSWIFVDLKVTRNHLALFDPIHANLTLRNSSELPLGIQPYGSIPSRLFIYVTARVAGRTLGTLNPIVVDMRRRLRLNPREAMSFDVRLDRSDFGRMLRTNKIDTIEFSAMAILDPNPRADGGVDRGLLGDRSWHHHMQRWGEHITEVNVQRWLQQLHDPDPVHRAEAMAMAEYATVFMASNIKQRIGVLQEIERKTQKASAARQSLQRQAQEQPAAGQADPDAIQVADIKLQEEQQLATLWTPQRIEEEKTRISNYGILIERVSQSLQEQFTRLNPMEQAWVVAYLPHQRKGSNLFAFVHDQAQRSDNPFVRVLYLAAQVTDPQSPAITEAMRHPDPRIAKFAEAVRDQLAAAAEPKAKG